jgi:phosphoglycolate phosphatase-like HAD superfamily hydrolase
MLSPPSPSFEVVNPNHTRGPFRCVVLDFDGTLSLLRGNWQGLMVPMMVETLEATGSGESRESLAALVEEFVTRLTGQPTMQQIEALRAEVIRRGQPPPDAQAYLNRYLDALLSRTAARIEELQAGRKTPDDFLIPGSRALLEYLQSRGLIMAIASGTELHHVVREAAILGPGRYVDSIYGPVENDPSFSKEAALRDLMAEHSLRGGEIVVIGDGPAEILAAKAVGALAIGVASDEVHQDGRINPLKREHLLRAGVDLIIPDYDDLPSIVRLLTPDS